MAAGFLTLHSAPAHACDIALALAVDVSGSIDAQEYELQMQGLALALRDGAISDALVRAKARISLIQWTGDSRQKLAVNWHDIASIEDVESFARAVEETPRAWRHYSTAIGAALEFTIAQFGPSEACKRRVIDVSGDGFSNEGVEPASLRSRIWQAGFTVNGLAIETSDEDLTGYYWENVVVGEKAFVMTANGFADYPERIKLKLLREVTQQVSHLPLPAPVPAGFLPDAAASPATSR